MLFKDLNNQSRNLYLNLIIIIISITPSSISVSTPSEAYLKEAKTLGFRLVACQKSGNHFVGRNTDFHSANLSISSTKGLGITEMVPRDRHY